jgi:antitoxin ParD1/3/4
MMIGASILMSIGTVRKTITLTTPQDQWVKAQIVRGGYTNDSEYIRALIRREQECHAGYEAIRAALIEGEDSGEPQPLDAQSFKDKMLAKHG